MMKTTANIYLAFGGNCEEAFLFYRSVLGGEFSCLARFSEMPASEGEGGPPCDPELLMHVSLPMGGGTVLMGSDTAAGCSPEGFQAGNNFSICLSPESREEADRLFTGLSEGGQEMMPMADTFWGAYFGMFKDRFGVQWMISFELPKE